MQTVNNPAVHAIGSSFTTLLREVGNSSHTLRERL